MPLARKAWVRLRGRAGGRRAAALVQAVLGAMTMCANETAIWEKETHAETWPTCGAGKAGRGQPAPLAALLPGRPSHLLVGALPPRLELLNLDRPAAVRVNFVEDVERVRLRPAFGCAEGL